MATVNLVSVCLGDCSTGSMRIGHDSNLCICASNATALGQRANASGDSATALGQEASAGGYNSTALGRGANALGSNSTALGRGANACDSKASTVVGQGAIANEDNSLVLQSGVDPCTGYTQSRIKICGDNISFRINGVCKSMRGSAFFAALGLS